MKKTITPWWGTYKFDENEARFWEIGPLSLVIERKTQEWRIASKSTDTADNSQLQIANTTIPDMIKSDLEFKRFVFQRTDASISLSPILSDRPQVTRAEVPFYLPPNEQVTIYVSSPAWVNIEANNALVNLAEIPTLRLSDTWYGQNTREGELCYSSSTFCRTNLDDLPARPHRVISPVIIYNNAKHPLLLERLSLPLPYLSVYADQQLGLLTEEIILKNEPHHKHSVRHGKGAPSIAPNATLVGQPRLHTKSTNLITLFYSLLAE